MKCLSEILHSYDRYSIGNGWNLWRKWKKAKTPYRKRKWRESRNAENWRCETKLFILATAAKPATAKAVGKWYSKIVWRNEENDRLASKPDWAAWNIEAKKNWRGEKQTVMAGIGRWREGGTGSRRRLHHRRNAAELAKARSQTKCRLVISGETDNRATAGGSSWKKLSTATLSLLSKLSLQLKLWQPVAGLILIPGSWKLSESHLALSASVCNLQYAVL